MSAGCSQSIPIAHIHALRLPSMAQTQLCTALTQQLPLQQTACEQVQSRRRCIPDPPEPRGFILLQNTS